MIIKQQNLLTNGQVKEVDNMNTELHNLLKKGFIKTKEDVALYSRYKVLSAPYKWEGEIVRDCTIFLFYTLDYYATVIGKVRVDKNTMEETIDILNQPIRFYGPTGEVSCVEELFKSWERYSIKQKNNEQLLLSYIFIKGSVETDSELKVFLDNSESIYEDDICLVDSPDNIPRRIFFSDDNRFYCEIAGNKRWDEEMQIYRLYSAPEKVRFYSSDGEEDSYLEVLKKMVAVYI